MGSPLDRDAFSGGNDGRMKKNIKDGFRGPSEGRKIKPMNDNQYGYGKPDPGSKDRGEYPSSKPGKGPGKHGA